MFCVRGLRGTCPQKKKPQHIEVEMLRIAPGQLVSTVIYIYIYNMNIYFKVVEVQIQASERILKLGRDSSHPGAVPKAHTRKIMEK